MNTNEENSELERFRHYLTQIEQLKEISRLDDADLYHRRLNEFDETIQTLMADHQQIEKFDLPFDENERSKMRSQVQAIREQIDHELTELHRLREQPVDDQTDLPIDQPTTDPDHIEDNHSILRQRHVSRNPLDASYDMLERDLIYLRQTVDDIDKLVAEQEQKLSRIELYRTIVHNRLHSASSLLSNVFYNRFTTTATGAVVGAGIAGPVGFTMGAKIGALLAFSGSAVGALSMNVMRQRVTEPDQVQTNDVIAYDRAML